MLLTTSLLAAGIMLNGLPPVAPGTPNRQPQLTASGPPIAMVFGSGKSVYFTASSDRGLTFSKPVEIASNPLLALGRHRGPRVAYSGKALLVSAIGGRPRPSPRLSPPALALTRTTAAPGPNPKSLTTYPTPPARVSTPWPPTTRAMPPSSGSTSAARARASTVPSPTTPAPRGRPTSSSTNRLTAPSVSVATRRSPRPAQESSPSCSATPSPDAATCTSSA